MIQKLHFVYFVPLLFFCTIEAVKGNPNSAFAHNKCTITLFTVITVITFTSMHLAMDNCIPLL